MAIGKEPKPTKARKAYQKALTASRSWCDREHPGKGDEGARNKCKQAQDVLLWNLGQHGLQAVYKPEKKKGKR